MEIWDRYVIVENAFKLHEGTIVAFLECPPGKLDTPLKLTDEEGRSWIMEMYLFTTSSFEGYKKREAEEARNVFQYLLKPVGHEEKPLPGTRLLVSKIK
ncbi:MAG: hypothetical protein J7578_14315 [Chitinophagaceae bacterium]|nr:hypothetical protein [Chitinophagaceae bacterium]